MTQWKKATLIAISLIFTLATASSVRAFGYGCYKKSEKMYDKCAKEANKQAKKVKTPEDREKVSKSLLKCVDQSEKFLLKCREKKGKLKPGKTMEELNEARSNIAYKRAHECLPECWEDCDKKWGIEKGKNVDVKILIEASKCSAECADKCDWDKLETEILKEFISTEK